MLACSFSAVYYDKLVSNWWFVKCLKMVTVWFHRICLVIVLRRPSEPPQRRRVMKPSSVFGWTQLHRSSKVLLKSAWWLDSTCFDGIQIQRFQIRPSVYFKLTEHPLTLGDTRRSWLQAATDGTFRSRVCVCAQWLHCDAGASVKLSRSSFLSTASRFHAFSSVAN